MTDESQFGRRPVLKGIGGLIALTGFAGQGSADEGDDERIYIGLEEDATIEDVRAEIEADPSIPDDAEIVHYNDVIDYAIVEVPSGPSTLSGEDAVEVLGKPSSIRYSESEPDPEPLILETRPAAVQPDDEFFDAQWAPQAINAPAAWETTTGSLDVTISVIDTGIDVDHEDLEDRITGDAGGPYVSPDSGQHGTHVAGCAAATTDNGVGTAGISDSRIIGFKSLNQQGGSRTPLPDAVVDSAAVGADIINMSFELGFNQALSDALEYANSEGVVCIAATGNDGQRDNVSFPAYHPDVLAVGATAEGGSVAGFSDSGPEMDVVAPGAQVAAPVPGDGYDRLSGTSMASPTAAGAIALAFDVNPNLSTAEVKDLVRETAEPLPGEPEARQANGQVDAAALVAAAGDGSEPDPEPPDEPEAVIDISTTAPSVGEEVSADGSGSSSPNGDIVEYAWDADPGGTGSGQSVTLTRDEEVTVDLTLTVTDEADQTDSASVTITFSEEDTDPEPDPDPDYPEWDAGEIYTGGDRVTYDGAVWEAQWWSQGDEPGSSQWGPWEKVEDIDDGDDGDDVPAWDSDEVYTEGDQVSYDGSVWEAQWWTHGDEPGSNQWGPWEQVN